MIRVGDLVEWSQIVRVRGGASVYEITPASGKVTISYLDAAGVRQYRQADGSFAPAPHEQACTITGNASRLAAFACPAIAGRTLELEGWINDDVQTRDTWQSLVLEAELPPSMTIRRSGT